MIDTIVFDMGQVLIRWTGALLLEQYGLSESAAGVGSCLPPTGSE